MIIIKSVSERKNKLDVKKNIKIKKKMKHSEMFKHIQFSVDSYSKRISSKITRLNSYDHQHYHHHHNHHCKKNTILKRTYSEPIINLKLKKNQTHSFSFKNVLKLFFSYNIILIFFLTFFY
jgi:hypothetical protein